ncbi:peptidase inhibitor family I36 protein [Streptomyces netropsis]
MRQRFLTVSAAAVAVAAMVWAPQAQAAGPAAGGAVAAYGQQQINLKQNGWGDAQSCVVHSKSTVRCFRTHAEADKALGYSRATDPLVTDAKDPSILIPACASGWTCLYEHSNGGGRRLIFNDYYWHNLNEYGFDNQTSSWRNNQTDSWSWLAGGTGGTGGQISLSTKSYSSNLGSYNDWASSVAA